MSYITGAFFTQTCSTYGDIPSAWVGSHAVFEKIKIPGTEKNLAMYPQPELTCEWDGKKIQHAAGSLGGQFARYDVPLRCLYVKGEAGELVHVEFVIACDSCWRLGVYDTEHEGFVVFNEDGQAVLYKLNGKQVVLESYPQPQWYPITPMSKNIKWQAISSDEESDLQASQVGEEVYELYSSSDESEVDTEGDEEGPSLEQLARFFSNNDHPDDDNLEVGRKEVETPPVKKRTHAGFIYLALAISASAIAIILGSGGSALLGLKLGSIVSETYFFYIAGGLLGGAFIASSLTWVAMWRHRTAVLKRNL